ncbi:hypothetical protein C7974DRAFT_312821 [Boeremia exigua]|uniref:uncharacterized protein n=1 Tax=Boeremia exigua TaxID=749465 RepID=UPI001E8E1C2E|nr:uncharacterized protein C7974DRAFT_312821 [Boeremia exigua]KAH6625796.1 hypothetical protein C7974DRAFT_312821 [Boeremia exigua]
MNATQAVIDWISAHPYQTAFHVVNGVIICTPAAATVPFLSALGFGATGPISGSAAASVMSYFSIVPAGGVFATAQSAAMGGYGAGLAAGAAQVGAALTSATAWLLGRNATAG